MAADTCIPLLNQLVCLNCCQRGVRSGGLGGAADIGVAMLKPEIQGLASLPERMKDTPFTPCKNKILHHDQTPASLPSLCFLPLLAFALLSSSLLYVKTIISSTGLAFLFLTDFHFSEIYINIQIIRFCTGQCKRSSRYMLKQLSYLAVMQVYAGFYTLFFSTKT